MRIVMTGATSGIGEVAATRLLEQGVDLIVGARSGPDALPGARMLRLDLADLDSVRAFADAVRSAPVDVLIGNAGLQVTKPQRSRQGYEVTFATNHLAHYLLVRSLLPRMAANSRVILTTSGTHDPDQKTGMPPPNHADAERLAHPERDPQLDPKQGKAGRRAYTASKLCNLMTVRDLARRTPDRADLSLIAFDPGFVPGTGLARDYGAALDWAFRRVFPLVIRGAHVSTPAVSGAALASLATDPAYAGRRGEYWAVHAKRLTLTTPSALARDDAACAKLWGDSARLVGL
jgi:protochlorophyllide reductase